MQHLSAIMPRVEADAVGIDMLFEDFIMENSLLTPIICLLMF